MQLKTKATGTLQLVLGQEGRQLTDLHGTDVQAGRNHEDQTGLQHPLVQVCGPCELSESYLVTARWDLSPPMLNRHPETSSRRAS
ncbi:hypothetical protein D3C72_2168120 [compost metagenome]